ncbi:alpha/beta hydrolase [Glaciibacter flavus]|uniref:alpha/beta hydrolase n=1 Tax=Orlajensenia flava TaxID=2565934 RepID=UPI001F3671A8|nr:alpha/beta fold hydrolase [Glaciibacter flavus]
MRWFAVALIGIVGGALVGLGLVILVNSLDLFSPPLTIQSTAWIMATFAGIGLAIVNLWKSRWWRKVIASVSIILFALVGTVGVNAYYGLNKTVGSLFGVVVDKPIDIRPINTATADPTQPVYKTWKPPADMPKTGKQGTQVIPASNFPTVRPAGIYLPPAALVKNAPPLPLVIMMMGLPGNPDPQYIGGVLDGLAAKNNGLAPIVIVADQIGTQGDPACVDSTKYGKAGTYVTKDVVEWAKENLNILKDPKYWTMAGYSNGGACAFAYVAQSPELFGNLADISGDEYAGGETPEETTRDVFAGDKQAFEAAKPTSILRMFPGKYASVNAVFTVGGNDPGFLPGAERNAKAAEAAGMRTTYYVVPGAGHVVDGLDGGLRKAFDILYPELGLRAP